MGGGLLPSPGWSSGGIWGSSGGIRAIRGSASFCRRFFRSTGVPASGGAVRLWRCRFPGSPDGGASVTGPGGVRTAAPCRLMQSVAAAHSTCCLASASALLLGLRLQLVFGMLVLLRGASLACLDGVLWGGICLIIL